MADQAVHDASTVPHPADDGSHSARQGFTAAAGMASLGSGAIHAAAIGVHAEHRQAALAFTVLALLQLGWGALALVRSGRLVSLAGIAVGLASVGGWVVAKTAGIAEREMLRTFNCGIGMIAVAAADQAGHVIDAFQECGGKAARIGHLLRGEGAPDVIYRGALKL